MQGKFKNLAIHCQTYKELGWGDRVVDLRTGLENFGKVRKKQVLWGERRDWGSNRLQLLPHTNLRDQVTFVLL